MSHKKLAMFDPVLVKPAIIDSFRKLNPAIQWRNPVMFVVYVGSILTTVLWVQALAGQGEAPAGFILAIALWLWFTVLFANFAEALAEGRSKAQAASLRGLKKETLAKKIHGTTCHRYLDHGAGHRSAQGRRLHRPCQRNHPGRRRGHRRRGLGGRIGDHRRVGTRHPRSGRRLLRRHRRHPRAVRLAGRARDRQSGRDLRRPHDRHGGKRQAPEDAQRDRADHPAGGADHRFSGRHRHPAALLDVQRQCSEGRYTHLHHGAHRFAGLPDPDHDRRPAVGHRRRRHEPHDAGQCHRHLRPCGRSGGRCRCAAAGQDRHDHAGQPPGDQLPACRRREGSGAGRCRPTCLARRRDAGRSQHRGSGQGQVQPARP